MLFALLTGVALVLPTGARVFVEDISQPQNGMAGYSITLTDEDAGSMMRMTTPHSGGGGGGLLSSLVSDSLGMPQLPNMQALAASIFGLDPGAMFLSDASTMPSQNMMYSSGFASDDLMLREDEMAHAAMPFDDVFLAEDMLVPADLLADDWFVYDDVEPQAAAVSCEEVPGLGLVCEESVSSRESSLQDVFAVVSEMMRMGPRSMGSRGSTWSDGVPCEHARMQMMDELEASMRGEGYTTPEHRRAGARDDMQRDTKPFLQVAVEFAEVMVVVMLTSWLVFLCVSYCAGCGRLAEDGTVDEPLLKDQPAKAAVLKVCEACDEVEDEESLSLKV